MRHRLPSLAAVRAEREAREAPEQRYLWASAADLDELVAAVEAEDTETIVRLEQRIERREKMHTRERCYRDEPNCDCVVRVLDCDLIFAAPPLDGDACMYHLQTSHTVTYFAGRLHRGDVRPDELEADVERHIDHYVERARILRNREQARREHKSEQKPEQATPASDPPVVAAPVRLKLVEPEPEPEFAAEPHGRLAPETLTYYREGKRDSVWDKEF